MPNSKQNFIEIGGREFEIINEVDNIPIADSFVKTNKLQGTCGHGEAKLYIGTQQKKGFDKFFEGFSGQSFFLKRDFSNYLEDAKFEYEQQEQKYRQDISEKWEEYHQKVQTFSNCEFFTIERAVPQDQARYYIKGEGDIFDFFRDVALPVISYVSIFKLKNSSGEIFFLFRPSLSYSFNPYYHPAKEREVEKEIEEKSLPEQEKVQLVEARKGQGVYRQKLLEESSECVVTKVNDERVLVASHIKPWSISSDDEKTDHNNGLVFTPTYDKLFDQGFISFNEDGTILLSPYISPLNLKKLNLAKGKKYNIPPSRKRNEYLVYHRENIFKK